MSINPKVNSVGQMTFLVALLEKWFENEGKGVTDEQLTAIRENYSDNAFLDNDEFVDYFRDNYWEDELAEKYGEVEMDEEGAYFLTGIDDDDE